MAKRWESLGVHVDDLDAFPAAPPHPVARKALAHDARRGSARRRF